jgi:signal transduction histidine kinase
MLAFAALLCVSALAAWGVWRNAREAQAQIAALHARDLRTHDALAAIRSSVYLIAILTRDYLLDPDLASVRDYVNQFNAIQASAKSNFETLNQAAQDDAQRSTVILLRMQLEAYWDTTQVMLDWSPEQKQAQRTDLLRQRMHRRQEIFALTERIEQLTSQTSAEERERIAAADRGFQSSLTWIAGGALLLGLGISGFTLARMRALERQSQAAEAELRMLSGEIRTAQERERKSLSRELHDQVGQMLTGIRMELAAVSRLHAAPESEIASRLARAKGTVEQTLGIVRNIAMLLRPSMLDDLGLTPALNWLVKEVSRSSGMDVRAEVDPQVDALPDAHRTCLYRVVQETLTNAVRHSGARTVELQVSTIGNWVQAVIADDGKGFEVGADKRRGLGLLGMEERVRELGGTLRVTSSPGRGTAVEIRLPRPIPAEEISDEDTDRGRSRDRADRIETAI